MEVIFIFLFLVLFSITWIDLKLYNWKYTSSFVLKLWKLVKTFPKWLNFSFRKFVNTQKVRNIMAILMGISFIGLYVTIIWDFFPEYSLALWLVSMFFLVISNDVPDDQIDPDELKYAIEKIDKQLTEYGFERKKDIWTYQDTLTIEILESKQTCIGDPKTKSLLKEFKHSHKIRVSFLNLQVPFFILENQARTGRIKLKLLRKLDIFDEGHRYKVTSGDLIAAVQLMDHVYTMSIIKQILYFTDRVHFEGDKIYFDHQLNDLNAVFSFKTLIERMQNILEIRNIKDKRPEHCIFCGQQTSDVICNECQGSMKCIICYKESVKLEEMTILTCCNSFAHTIHLVKWIQERKCPYCSTHDPLVIKL
ncbi:MAG: hypothetical protein INQ03_16520 [Candidatus Heimdallarchaeota archaeon]|nr:hypothetical protein [Candidatus Heimdallarchaeota archaeon]